MIRADVRLLVTAKAPVPGQAKTRLAATVGPEAAARLASAALRDTLETCLATSYDVHVALAGDLAGAADAEPLVALLDRARVFAQEGAGFDDRLAHAHATVGGEGALVVQVGMDTPQVTPYDLQRVVADAGDEPDAAVLGPADDGGWWVLALRDPSYAEALRGVPMSTATTGRDTEAALSGAGAAVRRTLPMRDVDEVDDAAAVSELRPDSWFARAWRETARR